MNRAIRALKRLRRLEWLTSSDVSEIGMSRVVSYFSQPGMATCAISADLQADQFKELVDAEVINVGDVDLDDDKILKRELNKFVKEQRKKLQSDIQSLGYGFSKMDGTYTDDKYGTSEPELSFIVPGTHGNGMVPPEEFRRQMRKLGQEFYQHSVLIVAGDKDAESGRPTATAVWMFMDESEPDDDKGSFSVATAEEVKKGLSQLLNKKGKDAPGGKKTGAFRFSQKDSEGLSRTRRRS
jgi:hypothetical protein